MKPSFNTLAEVYDYSTAKFAKKVANEFVGGEQRYTYAQFREKADNLSRVLSNF